MRKFILIFILLNFALSYQLLAQNSHDNLQQKSFTNTLSVYPNPIEDKINVNFIVKKDGQVSIRLMDVLGNEIATILNERYSMGEYRQSFNVPTKVTKGLYFVKVSVGSEVGIKRISIQ